MNLGKRNYQEINKIKITRGLLGWLGWKSKEFEWKWERNDYIIQLLCFIKLKWNGIKN